MTETQTAEHGSSAVWPDRALTDNQQRVREAAELMPVGEGGAQPTNFAQLVDYANWMARSQAAVPLHLRNNVGACLAVIEIAHKFGFPAYMVARQTYLVNDQIAFMGQLIMAIINNFCPLKERLKFRFEGEGADKCVIVTGHIVGEVDPVEYRSPALKDIPVKNSPLWKSDPEQQFCYFGARRWQSRYWPEGLFGIYSPEELAEGEKMDAPRVGAANAKDVTPQPSLRERLRGAGGEGFPGRERIVDHINSAISAARDPHHEQTIAGAAAVPAGKPGGDVPASTGAGVDAAASAPAQESDPPPAPLGLADEGERDGAAAEVPQHPTAAATDEPAARDSVGIARERGRAARKAGQGKRAVPPEYRDEDRSAEAKSWMEGWEEAG